MFYQAKELQLNDKVSKAYVYKTSLRFTKLLQQFCFKNSDLKSTINNLFMHFDVGIQLILGMQRFQIANLSLDVTGKV